MSAFELAYESLDASEPGLGQVAHIPWDNRIFGFNVGTYRLERATGSGSQVCGTLATSLDRWMERSETELLSCGVPANEFGCQAMLAGAGFVFVDLGLTAFARKLGSLPSPRIEIRLATAADGAGILAIAGSVFRFGRYHADARFPRSLANERYRCWMQNALVTTDDSEFVFVCGPQGAPTGFLHAVVRGGVADLRLAGVADVPNGGILGPSLFSGALAQLVARGARQATARLSAGNLAVLNLYGSLGFVFTAAEAIYHRHSASARHLAPANPAFNRL